MLYFSTWFLLFKLFPIGSMYRVKMTCSLLRFMYNKALCYIPITLAGINPQNAFFNLSDVI